MKGVQSASGRAEFEAIHAGNDMVEFVPDLEKAISSIKEAIAKNQISEEEINNKCRKVLALKRWVGLNEYQPTDLTHLTERLNSPYFEVTNRKLIKGSFTVLANNAALPVQNLEKEKIASVMIGDDQVSDFQKMLGKYTQVDHFVLSKNASEKDWVNLRQKLNNYTQIIAGINGIHKYSSQKYGTSEIQRKAVSELVEG